MNGAEGLLRHDPEVAVPDPALAAAIVVKTVEALTHNLVVPGDRDRDAYVEEIVRLVARCSVRRAAAPAPRRVVAGRGVARNSVSLSHTRLFGTRWLWWWNHLNRRQGLTTEVPAVRAS